jgi:phosphate starvation-inducible PhoH-like protein
LKPSNIGVSAITTTSYDPLDVHDGEFFEDNNLTRSQRKRLRRSKSNNNKQKASTTSNQAEKNNNFSLINVVPKTKNQGLAFQAYNQGQNLLLTGVPGSGKTFLASYMALRDLLDQNNDIEKIMIVRSSQPSRSIGFLPGTAAAKMEVYEAPYIGIFSELLGRADAYSILKKKGLVEFVPTSFLRGSTFTNCIVILEEYQNFLLNEIFGTLTRIGQNSRVILCGDVRQTDFQYEDEKFGYTHFIKIIDRMKSFSTIEFSVDDIVRSGFVKELLLETLKYMDKEKVNLF